MLNKCNRLSFEHSKKEKGRTRAKEVVSWAKEFANVGRTGACACHTIKANVGVANNFEMGEQRKESASLRHEIPGRGFIKDTLSAPPGSDDKKDMKPHQHQKRAITGCAQLRVA